MPELPEAETVRRGLAAELPGRVVTGVVASGVRSVRRHPDPRELGARLAGTRLVEVDRHGKYLMLRTARAAAGEVVVVHLGMSGQLRVEPARSSRPAHTHVVFSLDDGRELRFVDPRTFGEVFLAGAPTSPGRRPAELAHLGFDPLVDRVGPAAFSRLVRARRTQLKPLLMGQRLVAGLGNIYTDEILWAARLRPDRAAAGLSDHEARGLRQRMQAVLLSAVRHGGSSLADQQYRDLYGVPGRFQERHRVYGREDEPCARCGAPIARRRWGGRSTFFCPACQT